MRNVEPDQRWGVGAAADKGTDFANKNGWLSIDDSNGPGETDDGLWAVTSLGVLTVGGDQVLMAVLTEAPAGHGDRRPARREPREGDRPAVSGSRGARLVAVQDLKWPKSSAARAELSHQGDAAEARPRDPQPPDGSPGQVADPDLEWLEILSHQRPSSATRGGPQSPAMR